MQSVKLLSRPSDEPSGIRYKIFDEPQPYSDIYTAMRDFTLQRQANTPDEIWLLEHSPVFTQGQAGKSEHILKKSNIPIVQSDRGGQITYHGPGQVMIYCLLDLNRRNINIHNLINKINTVIMTLLQQEYNIQTHTDPKAPGIYVSCDSAKIASIGLRVRKNCSYHGVCLNVNSDLTPFLMINPCGYKDLRMTQISHYTKPPSLKTLYPKLITLLDNHFLIS